MVSETKKFKIGDRVRLIMSGDYNGDGRYGKTGEDGTVQSYTSHDDTYRVKFDDSGTWWAEANNIEPAVAKWEPKVGDRIRCIAGDIRTCRIGDDFTAVARTGFHHGELSSVHYTDKDGKKTWRPGVYFELANKPTTAAIVALIEDGVPKPATKPFVHQSEEAATKEAERLAGKHRGQRFGIYVLADTRETDQPNYDHEWQNLAARGEKIASIKALRAFASLDLLSAKKAVETFVDKAA